MADNFNYLEAVNMDNRLIKQLIEKVLKADDRLWDADKTELNQTLLLDLIEHIDETVIDLLLQEKELREKFFVKINKKFPSDRGVASQSDDGVFVFKTNDFRFFMEENKIDNSYTAYKNRIGLTDGKKFLKDTNDVVLNWPYKDCVLEGGQSTEEGSDTYFEYSEKTKQYEEKQGKRKEIFFNQVLAADEIDRLFDHKALTNWKRFTKDGEQEVKEIKRDEDGTIKENLIIKGNNLLALHSLKKQFAGKVKLIYIDPPYNTGNDGFKYNDNFNHSTWLTFMKNRLEVARELLSDDGVIYISIDHHENHTIKQICMEIFSESNFVQEIIVKTSTPTGFKIVNPGPVKITEQIIIFAKNKPKYLETENELFVLDKYDPEYSNFIINYEEDYTKWKIGKLKDIVIKEIGTEKMNKLKEEDKELYEYLLKREMPRLAIEYADRLFSTKKPHKPAPVLKEVMEKSKAQPGRFLRYKKQDGSYYYLLNGRLLAFYSSKLKKINNSLVPAKHLTNLWDDISWSAVDKESGVKLPNGKKPEKLLERIITLSTKPGDIVLDFFMGTGTTCAVAHKMGRQYIGIEQLDYGENDSVVRLQDVINGDQSGISKSVNWQGGGNFIYFELAKWNETAKEKILECESLEELEKFFDEMYERYFLNYNLKIKEFKEKVLKEENFRNLSLDKQKKIFITMLDNNQMYVNKTEMADKKFGISEEDQNLTNQFYNKEE